MSPTQENNKAPDSTLWHAAVALSIEEGPIPPAPPTFADGYFVYTSACLLLDPNGAATASHGL